MVYTIRFICYIPKRNYLINEDRVSTGQEGSLSAASGGMPMVSEIKYTDIISMLRP
ncbi:MAG: hypothetical protein LBV64_05885 [Mediterranea sp.]|nr:hypothetical protein [Mediterranea sp.]